MKITINNEHTPINHSHKQTVIHSLLTKIKKIWNQLQSLFIRTFTHTNKTDFHKNEIILATFTPTKLTLDELVKIHEDANKINNTPNEPLYEGINPHIYEEIPAMKGLIFPDKEPIYDVPTNNRPVIEKGSIYKTTVSNALIYQTPTNNKPVVTKELSKLIADLESHLDNAKKSTSPLRIFEGSELSI